jgi:hypothetical protein
VTPCSEEQVIEQQIAPFMGDDLAAALVPGGNIYITLAGMCIEVRLDALWETVEDVGKLVGIPLFHFRCAFSENG